MCAMKDRAAESTGGPDGQSTWWDNGFGFTIQNHAAINATTTANNLPAGIIPVANKVIPGGGVVPDTLASGAPIQSISGVQIAMSAALAAQATLTLAVSIWRAGAQLGGGPIWGWTAAGGGTPAFAALTAVAMPLISGGRSPDPVVTYTAGSLVLLQPLDIPVLTLQTSSGTVSVPVGTIAGTVT